MLYSFILAFSVSIDSLGIGITYGIKNAKLNFLAKFILFIMSVFFTSCSLIIGDFLSSFLSELFTGIISSTLLIIMGIIILLDPIPFDFNHSNVIDVKEAFALGIALSLDSLCVGIGSSIGGYSNIYFPILVAVFQLIFISIGIIIGRKIAKSSNIPEKTWNKISGGLLICFGIIKLFI